jgi:ribosomal protein L31
MPKWVWRALKIHPRYNETITTRRSRNAGITIGSTSHSRNLMHLGLLTKRLPNYAADLHHLPPAANGIQK